MVWNVYRTDVTHYTKTDAGLPYLAVALHADSNEGARYIEFQLGDEEDRDWGYRIIDGPPSVFAPGGLTTLVAALTRHASAYGGLVAAAFSGADLVLTFIEEAQSIFEWPEVLTLHLSVTDEAHLAASLPARRPRPVETPQRTPRGPAFQRRHYCASRRLVDTEIVSETVAQVI